MIDAVVNTSADYVAKTRLFTVPEAVVNATTSTTNTKTTKAIEVESQASAVNGKDLVENEVVKKEKQDKIIGKEGQAKVEAEVESLAKEMNDLTRNFGLSFAKEQDLNRTVVTVTDTKTDEVIRQIPTEEFLKFARKINTIRNELNGEVSAKELQGLLVNKEI